MGAGNYLPSRDVGDYEMVYVSLGEGDDWDIFVEEVRACLPASFDHIKKHRTRCLQVSESGLLSVCVADNQWSTAVFVCPNDFVLDGHPELLNLAYRHLSNVMKRIKKALSTYELSVRAGPWCSSKI